jgi:hypothetical protein
MVTKTSMQTRSYQTESSLRRCGRAACGYINISRRWSGSRPLWLPSICFEINVFFEDVDVAIHSNRYCECLNFQLLVISGNVVT